MWTCSAGSITVNWLELSRQKPSHIVYHLYLTTAYNSANWRIVFYHNSIIYIHIYIYLCRIINIKWFSQRSSTEQFVIFCLLIVENKQNPRFLWYQYLNIIIQCHQRIEKCHMYLSAYTTEIHRNYLSCIIAVAKNEEKKHLVESKKKSSSCSSPLAKTNKLKSNWI